MHTSIRTTPGRARINGRGFSLIEIIVVILIIGIVARVAIAQMASSRQARQRTAVRTLAVNIAFCRERALTTGRATWVYFYTNTETITLFETISAVVTAIADPATNVQMTTVLGASSENAQFAECAIGTVNGSTSASAIILGFDWQGRPTNSGGTLLTADWPVTVTQTGQTTITLTVVAETGLVTIAY